MSFIDSINAIETRLKNFQPLKDFLQATFNKTLLVKKTVRDRTTVGQDEFPLVMITRPRIERVRAGNSVNLDNSVFLYAGISQPDRNIALEQMIRYEELIEDAVLTRTDIPGDLGMVIVPGDSLNDEGLFHPHYFMVKHFTVKDR